jgi:sec-independent protein translocase protein TatA
MTPTFPLTLALFGSFGWQEVVVLALLGVLIFGKRLPEVGKSIGKGIVEFKKGLAGVEDDIDKAGGDAKQIEGQKHDTQSTASSETKEKTAST